MASPEKNELDRRITDMEEQLKEDLKEVDKRRKIADLLSTQANEKEYREADDLARRTERELLKLKSKRPAALGEIRKSNQDLFDGPEVRYSLSPTFNHAKGVSEAWYSKNNAKRSIDMISGGMSVSAVDREVKRLTKWMVNHGEINVVATTLDIPERYRRSLKKGVATGGLFYFSNFASASPYAVSYACR